MSRTLDSIPKGAVAAGVAEVRSAKCRLAEFESISSKTDINQPCVNQPGGVFGQRHYATDTGRLSVGVCVSGHLCRPVSRNLATGLYCSHFRASGAAGS